jgi:hypothetical protein
MVVEMFCDTRVRNSQNGMVDWDHDYRRGQCGPRRQDELEELFGTSAIDEALVLHAIQTDFAQRDVFPRAKRFEGFGKIFEDLGAMRCVARSLVRARARSGGVQVKFAAFLKNLGDDLFVAEAGIDLLGLDRRRVEQTSEYERGCHDTEHYILPFLVALLLRS